MIGAVTDDFTGTASAGVLIAKSQVKTGLFFDAEAVEQFPVSNQLGAIFVSSNSRHLKPADAYKEVGKTTEALKKIGVTSYSKKIDTTLRGGIGFEIDAMLDALDEDMIAVMVTAMPQSKRICVGGFSVIDGVILTETPVAHDVKTPVRECYVPDLIQAQTKRKVALITIQNVLNGKESLQLAMQDAQAKGGQILIIDAITLEHIDTIAQVCVDLKWNILAVDPGAFTMKLNYHRGLIQEEAASLTIEEIENHEKTALFIVGSANPSTKAQVQYLCQSGPNYVRIPVAPDRLMQGGEASDQEISRVVEQVLALLKQTLQPRSIILETALHNCVLDLKEEDRKHQYPEGTCSKRINQGLAQITDRIMEEVGQERIAGLLLTGGDTMECVCRKLQVSCIQAVDNIVAQVDVGRIIGKYNGLPIIVKGGFCGYEEIGPAIVKRLFWEAAR